MKKIEPPDDSESGDDENDEMNVEEGSGSGSGASDNNIGKMLSIVVL